MTSARNPGVLKAKPIVPAGSLRKSFSFLVVALTMLTGTVVARPPDGARWDFRKIAELPPAEDGSTLGVAGPLVGVHGSVLILGGGANFPEAPPWEGGEKKFYDAIRILEKKTDSKKSEYSWTASVFSLPFPLAYPACVSTDSGIVSCGGENAGGKRAETFLLQWDPVAKQPRTDRLDDLPEPRSNAAAVVSGGRVYLLGGETDRGPSREVWSLEWAIPGARWKKEVELSVPVSHAAAVVQSDGEQNRIYLLGGRAGDRESGKETVFYCSIFSWRPGETAWKRHADLTDSEGNELPFSAACAASSGMASIILFGGDTGTIFRRSEELSKAIGLENEPETRKSLQEELKRLRTEHPGFSRNIFIYNTITDCWCLGGELPFAAPVTTTVVPWNREIVFPSGEIRPGVRTPDIQSLRLEPRPRFGTINYIVLGLYALGMISLGFIFNERDETTRNFFTGGGKLPWWVVGISIFATTLSAITFLSIPAKAFASDWRMIWLNTGILLIAPFIIRFYLPFFRQLKTESAYEYLETRFNLAARWIASALFCTFMVARIAIVLYLPSLAVNVITGMNVYACIVLAGVITIFYCTLGGMKAVVWGDVIQGGILVLGAAISLVFLVAGTDGGFSGFLSLGESAGKFYAFDMALDWSRPCFWVVMLGGASLSLITYSSDQTIIQRYMSTQDEKKAAQGIWLNAAIALPVTVMFFLIGSGLYTYYSSHPSLFPVDLANNDAIYPYFIVHSLPPGISGVLVAAIFAAAMSTLSSNINSASAAVTCDFVKRLLPELPERRTILCAKIAGIVTGVAGIILAAIMAGWDIKSLWDQFNFYLGLLTGSLGGLFLMGIFSKRIDGVGALFGLIASFFLVLLVSLHTSCSFLLYGLLGIVFCYATGYAASVLHQSFSGRGPGGE